MSDSEHGSVQNAARNSSQQPEEEQQEQENYLMTFNQFVRIAGSIYLGREFAEDNPFEVVGLGQGRANDETKRAFVDFVACGKLPGPRNRVASLHLDPLEIEERDPDAPEIRVSRDLDSAYGRSQTLCLKLGFDVLKMPNEKDLLKKSLGTKVEISDNGVVSAYLSTNALSAAHRSRIDSQSVLKTVSLYWDNKCLSSQSIRDR